MKGPAFDLRTTLVAWSLSAGLLTHVATVAADPIGVDTHDRSRDDASYYRGRAAPRPPAEALLWVPRALFFPLWALAEYGIRTPVRALIRWSDESHAPGYVARAFHPIRNVSWVPTAVIDIGVLPSVGIHVHWNHALIRTNEVRATFATGGAEFWLANAADRLRIDDFSLGIRGYFMTRPDRLFYGLGPRSLVDNRTYYRLTRREAHVFGLWEPSTHVALSLDTFYRSEDTGPGWAPFIAPTFQLPEAAPGIGPIQLFMIDSRLALDSRHDRVGVTGLRLDAHAVYAVDPTNRERQFVQGEIELQGALEVFRPLRALVLSLYAADTESLGREPVPFEEQIFLGRDRHQGFLYGRFIDASATLATLTWRWPVWDQMDMFIEGSVGNVFGPHFQGFDPRLFTTSIGTGLRTRIDNAAAFRLIVAAGTTRFDQPFGIDGVRFFASIDPGL